MTMTMTMADDLSAASDESSADVSFIRDVSVWNNFLQQQQSLNNQTPPLRLAPFTAVAAIAIIASILGGAVVVVESYQIRTAVSAARRMNRALVVARRTCCYSLCRGRAAPGFAPTSYHHSRRDNGRVLARSKSSSSSSTSLFGRQSNGISGSVGEKMSTNTDDGSHPFLLTEQLATRLVRGDSDEVGNEKKEKKEKKSFLKPLKACIAVAGGGSNAAASIASTPGASSLLLESIVTYDRRSYADFVTQNVLQMNDSEGDDGIGWGMDLEDFTVGGPGEMTSSSSNIATSCSDGNANESSSSNDGKVKGGSSKDSSFKFCSAQAAVLLSRSALHRALRLTPGFRDRSLNCIGVGCTSSLVSRLSKEGEEIGRRKGRKSRAYIACSTLRGGTLAYEVRLDGGGGNADRRRRSRLEEEAVVSNLVLFLMMRYREEQSCEPLQMLARSGDGSNNVELNDILRKILNREGDDITGKRIDNLANDSIDEDMDEKSSSAAFGASQIIKGDANVVGVLPVPRHNSRVNKDEKYQQSQQLVPASQIQMETLFSDASIPLPDDVIIVPGSFNPPHRGHLGLANAAVAALRRKRKIEARESTDGSKNAIASSLSKHYSRYPSLSSVSSASAASSVLKSMWDAVDEYSEEDHPTVLFEMSVTNADKPPLDPSEVERRVDLFASLPSEELPKDWAVILTNAPLFSQKTSVLDNLISLGNDDPGDSNANGFGAEHQNGSGEGSNARSRRKMSFVLGTDTFVRIINPKYYGSSRENMLAALEGMKKMGVHFIVGGRLEQGTENRLKFVNGKEEVKSLPSKVQEMFTLLTEDEFRLDISSTELRKQVEQKQ
eukprot:CAMPEP_0181119148 /NCGR_PEP_ID=MMETSP1071-20121207/23454_1 /TAXON_ID=35127 /ORGANISM="Thalassiosira sp., Strain NH16" /LENGTH=835 /DNA_ID=CAMNT_0023203689 /DNA_START=164 /DNA_END=2673 /DNA_ORIENTATION=-